MKKQKKKTSKYVRTCEQCGNEYFMKKPVSWCPYCQHENDFRKGKSDG